MNKKKFFILAIVFIFAFFSATSCYSKTNQDKEFTKTLIDSYMRMGQMNYIMEQYEKAFECYHKAATEFNHAEAQFMMGLLYHEGEGVTKNYQEAIKWFTKAAERNDVKAQISLGVMYHEGEGIRQNYQEAIKWFTKAAEQNDNLAQYYLGAIYEKGHGIKPNLTLAKELYGKACDNGNQDGCNAYKKLNESGY